jgi:hypothetical protein
VRDQVTVRRHAKTHVSKLVRMKLGSESRSPLLDFAAFSDCQQEIEFAPSQKGNNDTFWVIISGSQSTAMMT